MHMYAWCIDRRLRSHETCNITDARVRAHPISGAIQLCTPNGARTRDGKTTPGWHGECCEGPVGLWVPSCISGSSVGMHPGPQTRSGVQDCVRTLMHLDWDFNDFHAVALACGPWPCPFDANQPRMVVRCALGPLSRRGLPCAQPRLCTRVRDNSSCTSTILSEASGGLIEARLVGV